MPQRRVNLLRPLLEKSYKSRIYQTHGVATNDFIRIGGARVEGTLMADGPMLVADDLSASNPIKSVAQGYNNGMDTCARVMMTVRNRRWTLLP